MGSLTNFAETEIMDHIFNGSDGAGSIYAPPATVYLSLHTADPTDTGSVAAECAGSGYIRKAIAFSAAATRAVVQNGVVTFDQAGGAWGTISHWGICTADTGGNMLAYGSFAVSKSIVSGNTASVATTEVVITATADVGLSTYCAHKILDFLFRNQAFTPPATYIGLVTANPTDASTGATLTEPSTNNYARKLVDHIAGVSPTWAAAGATTGLVDNVHTITFATPSGSWGLITGMVVIDSITVGAGNVLFYEVDVTDQTPDNGDTVQIAAGAFDVTMD
jgi:hypothetical protein